MSHTVGQRQVKWQLTSTFWALLSWGKIQLLNTPNAIFEYSALGVFFRSAFPLSGSWTSLPVVFRWGCFAPGEAACTPQDCFHLAWALGVWKREKKSQPRVKGIGERWLGCHWKNKQAFWNSLTLLFRWFLPPGTLLSLSSSRRKHPAYFLNTSQLCFVCFCCQRSTRQCVCFVIDCLSLNCFRSDGDLFQWVISKRIENGLRIAEGWGNNEKRGYNVGNIFPPALLGWRQVIWASNAIFQSLIDFTTCWI